MTTNNDIPVAQRVAADPKSQKSSSQMTRSLRVIPWWGYGLAVLAFFLPLAGSRFWVSYLEPGNAALMPPKSATSGLATPELTPSSSTTSIDTSGNFSESSLLGHFAYAEAPINSLRSIGRSYDGYEVRMRASAAKSYIEMTAAARASGVDLVPISAFRTKDEQRKLFFDIKANRNQTAAERALVSAPPGYSEHHTGYAVDIGDRNNPSTQLSPSFDKTEAFKWLEQNAAKYSFEMSFPPSNKQGVMYEPWHWRFTGDDDSLAAFYKANPSNQASTKSFIKSPGQSFISSPSQSPTTNEIPKSN